MRCSRKPNKRVTLVLMLAMALHPGPAVFADYETGLIAAISGDYEKALEEWETLANLGDSAAQNGLGWLYYRGYAVPKDYKIAFELFARSANQGFAKGQANLGLMYRDGHGVTQNYKTAVELFKQSAAQGYSAGQGNLAKMYRDGKGVEQNYRLALHWFLKAAEERSSADRLNPKLRHWKEGAVVQSEAQFNLGMFYMNGNGVKQDYETAFDWFRLSAELGRVAAQNNLGFMYANGLGVSQDFTRAYMWWHIAGSRGYDDANHGLSAVEKYMAPDQIQKATSMAQECVAIDYKGC